jgi:hypothetical protein
MKTLLPVALLALAMASTAWAQDDRALPSNPNIAADFANTSLGTPFSSSDVLLGPSTQPRPVNTRSFAEPWPVAEPAEPSPAPVPKYVYGGRDDFRWQLALGISLVRFRSSLYYATGVGTNTSVTYFTNEWLGVEGNINTAFAPTINQNQHIKYVSYGGGPKIAWRARKWEPWLHTIVGGAHILPQTAGFGQNGLALQVGGGTDYRIYPHLSARVELDWVRTHLFSAWQNSAQANLDIVLHF